MDWNTGLSKTDIKALRSAPTCLLFRRSSVCRTLVCTSFKRSRAARVSLDIGILIWDIYQRCHHTSKKWLPLLKYLSLEKNKTLYILRNALSFRGCWEEADLYRLSSDRPRSLHHSLSAFLVFIKSSPSLANRWFSSVLLLKLQLLAAAAGGVRQQCSNRAQRAAREHKKRIVNHRNTKFLCGFARKL